MPKLPIPSTPAKSNRPTLVEAADQAVLVLAEILPSFNMTRIVMTDQDSRDDVKYMVAKGEVAMEVLKNAISRERAKQEEVEADA